MENNLSNTKNSSTHSVRHRRSIFSNERPKPDEQDPKLLINGETLSDWETHKPSTEPNFFTESAHRNEETFVNRNHESYTEARRMAGSFHFPTNNVSRVVITDQAQTTCIRPASVGKRSVIITQPQVIERPVSFLTQSRVMVPQPQILTASRIIPSQTANIIPTMAPNIIINSAPSNLKRKCVLVEGRPHENVIFRHSPIKTKPVEVITEIRPEISRVVIQDDPKTISELNKLTSLNQFLTHQYTLVNNELIEIRNRTCHKEFVDGKAFLEKSLNKIDEIFLKETNQALYKFDEISRCSSSKGFSRSSNSRLKRNPLPTFNRNVQNLVENSGIFTPIKGVEQMQNSSYTDCNHIDPESVCEHL